jgi:hypothetical protein
MAEAEEDEDDLPLLETSGRSLRSMDKSILHAFYEPMQRRIRLSVMVKKPNKPVPSTVEREYAAPRPAHI